MKKVRILQLDGEYIEASVNEVWEIAISETPEVAQSLWVLCGCDIKKAKRLAACFTEALPFSDVLPSGDLALRESVLIEFAKKWDVEDVVRLEMLKAKFVPLPEDRISG